MEAAQRQWRRQEATLHDEVAELQRQLRELSGCRDAAYQATAEAHAERRRREAAEAQLVAAQAELSTAADDWSVRLQLAEQSAAAASAAASDSAAAAAAGEGIDQAVGLAAELDEWKAAATTLRAEVAAGDRRFERESAERRRLHNELQELRGNIRVLCRVRPLDSYSTSGAIAVEGVDGSGAADGGRGQLAVANPMRGEQQTFEFDRVYVDDPKAAADGAAGAAPNTNTAVYQEVQPAVISALDGYNVCCFAYGQTGSGKTHTMSGAGSRSPGSARAALRFRSQSNDAVQHLTPTKALPDKILRTLEYLRHRDSEHRLTPPAGLCLPCAFHYPSTVLSLPFTALQGDRAGGPHAVRRDRGAAGCQRRGGPLRGRGIAGRGVQRVPARSTRPAAGLAPRLHKARLRPVGHPPRRRREHRSARADLPAGGGRRCAGWGEYLHHATNVEYPPTGRW